MKLKDYTIAICLVPYGYEIDLLDHKDYLNGKATIVHSECRDYGCDIDIEELSSAIIQGVRDAEKRFAKLPEIITVKKKRKKEVNKV